VQVLKFKEYGGLHLQNCRFAAIPEISIPDWRWISDLFVKQGAEKPHPDRDDLPGICFSA
jgi:hypothetical protein